jgi:hypothetical protein
MIQSKAASVAGILISSGFTVTVFSVDGDYTIEASKPAPLLTPIDASVVADFALSHNVSGVVFSARFN